MAKKTFKIGEYAVGGIIKVETKGKVIQIKIVDYDTKEEMSTFTTSTDDDDFVRKISDFLHDMTTSYYTGVIIERIKEMVGATNAWHY